MHHPDNRHSLRGQALRVCRHPGQRAGNGVSTDKPCRLTITENYLLVKEEVSVGNYTILKTQGYEATVENIISSVIYHEWYGHHICGYSEEQGNHQKCYEASKACPFYEQTTENYKAFVEQSIK